VKKICQSLSIFYIGLGTRYKQHFAVTCITLVPVLH